MKCCVVSLVGAASGDIDFLLLDRGAFGTYIEKVLLPELKPGLVVNC